MSWLDRFRGRRAPRHAVARGLVLDRPGATIYAVGDLHGCHALFLAMQHRILTDPHRLSHSQPVMILLGDLIDRGPQSARLIDDLCAPAPAGLERHCLAGNHEAMALDFLAAPDPASRWLDFGGSETLASYGLSPDARHRFRGPARRLAAQIDACLPPAHLRFLHGLPQFIRVGGHFFSHAGPDPAFGPHDQPVEQLLWSDAFLRPEVPAPDWLQGGLAVQGHVVVDEVLRRGWRIDADTGAYATGRLSAVRLGPDGSFCILTVTAEEAGAT
jgi:serine/threonine protein phosphatase 1